MCGCSKAYIGVVREIVKFDFERRYLPELFDVFVVFVLSLDVNYAIFLY